VGVGVTIGVAVGVAVGVVVGQLSLPMVINVPGELWLLNSVVIHSGLLNILLRRTSSTTP
jgi:hypothetical protein